MGKAIDFTNTTQGNLTIGDRLDPSKPLSLSHWYVRCECGEEGIRSYAVLKKGAGDCGCSRAPHPWRTVSRKQRTRNVQKKTAQG